MPLRDADVPPYSILSHAWGTPPRALQNDSHLEITFPSLACRHRIHRMPASGEIRVLDLLPGKSGPVECELLHVSLDNSGHYETLSYV